MSPPDAAVDVDGPPPPGAHSELPSTGDRVYAGIPLDLTGPADAEAALLAARTLLHEDGPLAEVGRHAGCHFRGGSVVSSDGCAVVTCSWLTGNPGRREVLRTAFGQHSGHVRPDVIAAVAGTLPRGQRAPTSALAETVDDWLSGYGMDPTAVTTPPPEEVDHIMRAGWLRTVLV
jgi:hypothetical protein